MSKTRKQRCGLIKIILNAYMTRNTSLNTFECSHLSLHFNVVDRELDYNFDPTFRKCLESLQFNQSVTIDSSLDKIPGHKFSTDDFIDDMITSKYYTPHEFKQARLDKRFYQRFT